MLARETNYSTFGLQTSLPLEQSDALNYEFATGDYNRDGIPDLFVFKLQGNTNTEVLVLNGATSYQTFLVERSTPIEKTSSLVWTFGVGDYNGDGIPDMIGVKMNRTGSGTTEVNILDGANNFQKFDLQTATALPTVSPNQFQFGVGDYNGDGRPDLYTIKMNGTGSGTTEVNILDGASNFQKFDLQTATALSTVTRTQFSFAV